MVLDESCYGMKVVLDKNFWDEKLHFHPNFNETVPNLVFVFANVALALVACLFEVFGRLSSSSSGSP